MKQWLDKFFEVPSCQRKLRKELKRRGRDKRKIRLAGDRLRCYVFLYGIPPKKALRMILAEDILGLL